MTKFDEIYIYLSYELACIASLTNIYATHRFKASTLLLIRFFYLSMYYYPHLFMFRIVISILLYIYVYGSVFLPSLFIFSWYLAVKFSFNAFHFNAFSCFNELLSIITQKYALKPESYLNLFRFDINISLSLSNLWLWSISRIHLSIHFHWAAALSHLSFIGIRYVFIWYFRKFSLSSYSQCSQITITCLVSSLKDDNVSN